MDINLANYIIEEDRRIHGEISKENQKKTRKEKNKTYMRNKRRKNIPENTENNPPNNDRVGTQHLNDGIEIAIDPVGIDIDIDIDPDPSLNLNIEHNHQNRENGPAQINDEDYEEREIPSDFNEIITEGVEYEEEDDDVQDNNIPLDPVPEIIETPNDQVNYFEQSIPRPIELKFNKRIFPFEKIESLLELLEDKNLNKDFYEYLDKDKYFEGYLDKLCLKYLCEYRQKLFKFEPGKDNFSVGLISKVICVKTKSETVSHNNIVNEGISSCFENVEGINEIDKTELTCYNLYHCSCGL